MKYGKDDTTFAVEKKVFAAIEEKQMILPGDTVVLGVSGGADSVCLFFVLLAYREKVPFSMRVVHVNHGVRTEAVEDQAYVESLCKQFEVPFQAVCENIYEVAKAEKCSPEDAGRRVRYKAFSQEADKYPSAKIAVAHNANDRAETMLLNLFRGSGMRGLRSIEATRDRIIRPLLTLERGEIEAYLQAREITWCTDATNLEDLYTRNKVRHHILDYAGQEICDRTVAHMNRTADVIAEAEDFLTDMTEAARKRCVKDDAVEVGSFLELHKAIQNRLLLQLLEEKTPYGKDIRAVHIEDVRELFTRDGNRSIQLPFDICCRRQYGKVYITSGEAAQGDALMGPELLFSDFGYEEGGEIPQNQYTKWFDYDKIRESLDVRTRQVGDYLTVSDGKGGVIHKSVKKYMIEEKIPEEQRDRIYLLAEGNHVLWIIGYRISEYYKIGPGTEHILQVECRDRQ